MSSSSCKSMALISDLYWDIEIFTEQWREDWKAGRDNRREDTQYKATQWIQTMSSAVASQQTICLLNPLSFTSTQAEKFSEWLWAQYLL